MSSEAPERADIAHDAPMGIGVEVPIVESLERWSEVRLGDGAVLQLKTSVVAVYRTGKCDENGEPEYLVRGQSVVVVHAPAVPLGRKQ